MCRPTPTAATTTTAVPERKPVRLLLSLSSYDYGSGEKPGLTSCVATGALFVAFLVGVEQLLRWGLASMQDSHPLLENETHRQILARHIGVDTLSCFVVAVLGWWSRGLLQGAVDDTLRRSFHKNYKSNKTSNPMPLAAHDQRLYTYHAGAFRVCLFFFFYQIKNLADTLVWNDGPEFIFHHVFSLLTAYGAMTSGTGFMYSIFFFGLSEISTGVLCLLANFDDQHGVPGLGDAFPLTKVAVGGVFAVLFIVCRCIIWPWLSWYFCRDVLAALRGNDERTQTRRGWLQFFLVSLSGLSVLQVAWLGLIFVKAGEELAAVGLL